jgi:hypothetical protein
MARARRLVFQLIFLAVLAGTASQALAASSEMAVKAAFLPRFARYVTWPPGVQPSSSAALVLCTVGRDPFGGLLEQSASGQEVDGRRIIVRRLSSATGVRGCHVVFVGGSPEQPAGQLLAAIGRLPILTVTDSANASQRGIVHFAIVSGRVRFFIDEAAAAERRLTISSRLLGLAVAVRTR